MKRKKRGRNSRGMSKDSFWLLDETIGLLKRFKEFNFRNKSEFLRFLLKLGGEKFRENNQTHE